MNTWLDWVNLALSVAALAAVLIDATILRHLRRIEEKENRLLRKSGR